jgi:hypothetical protein
VILEIESLGVRSQFIPALTFVFEILQLCPAFAFPSFVGRGNMITKDPTPMILPMILFLASAHGASLAEGTASRTTGGRRPVNS